MDRKYKNLSEHELIYRFSNDFNCNIIEKNLIKCYVDLDKKWFFKTRKYKKCQNIDLEYRNCLINSNDNRLIKKEFVDINQKYKEDYEKVLSVQKENKANTINYLEGSEENKDKKVKGTSRLYEL